MTATKMKVAFSRSRVLMLENRKSIFLAVLFILIVFIGFLLLLYRHIGPDAADESVSTAETSKRFAVRLQGDEPYLIFCKPHAKHLIVVFHTWSASYMQALSWADPLRTLPETCVIAPDYNGPNDQPRACASKDALDRVQRLVKAFRRHSNIKTVSLIGASGGGYMALMFLGTHPESVDNASIWLPIYNLATWYDELDLLDHDLQYSLEGCFGHKPSGPRDRDYIQRSPVSVLGHVSGHKNVVINVGKHDGLPEYHGSVLPYHGKKAAQDIRKACPECYVRYVEFNGAHDFHMAQAVRQIANFIDPETAR